MINPFVEKELDFQIERAVSEEYKKKLQRIKDKGSDKLKSDYINNRILFEEAYNRVTVHVSNNSGKYEWYTPSRFTDAARLTMGSIDLDPASSEIANKSVQSEKIYTEQENGLTKSWSGNVWMNPPYNNSLVSEFTKKLVEELPNIKQACVLVNNATETKWFHYISEYCSAICILKGRIKFIDMDGNETGTGLQGQVIMYFGKDIDKFKENFKSFGKVWLTQ